MKKYLIVVLGLLIFSQLHSQCPPVSENMVYLDRWDEDNLYPYDNPNDHFNDCWAYVASDGTEYGIIGAKDSIFIINVDDPRNIFRVNSIYQGDRSTWRDFKVYGDYLYSIVDGGSNTIYGIVIYDLTALPAITRVKNLNKEFTKCHNIYIDEANAKLYAVGMSQPMDICVYDLSIDPANPTLWGAISFDSLDNSASSGYYIHDIFVKDNIAYCSTGWSGYYVWDMSVRTNINLLGYLEGSFFDAGYVHSSWNSDDDSRAIIATEVGGDPKLYWVDQSDFSLIEVLDEWKDPLCVDTDPSHLQRKRPHNPYIVGDKIYVSHYHDGLQVLSIDFAEDTLGRAGYYDTNTFYSDYARAFPGCWGAYPYLPSGTILASDQRYGLFTLKYEETPTYYFVGPGINWETPANWDGGAVPPIDYDGVVRIRSNCEKISALGLGINSQIYIEDNFSFVIK